MGCNLFSFVFEVLWAFQSFLLFPELPLLPVSFFLMLVLSLTFLWEAFLGCLVHLECLSNLRTRL